MLTVTVAQDGSGDFASIAEAVLAVPYEEEALVQVGPGIYREKLVCEKQDITLIGAGPDKTCIVTTHRPSVLSMCSRVYRVLDTRVTELSEEESARMVMDF